MTISYSGIDGAESFNVSRSDPTILTSVVTRGFMKFDTSPALGASSATLVFTVLNSSGVHMIRLRAAGDIIGDAPDIPSREDNWVAFDDLTVFDSVDVADTTYSVDVTSVLTSSVTSFRFASSKENVSGTWISSVYTSESLVSSPFIVYTSTSFVASIPVVSVVPTVFEAPLTGVVPSVSAGISGVLEPSYDWGIRQSSDFGDVLPPTEAS